MNGSPPIASKPLNLLILGGTGFIGPYHVRAAVARGHRVTVFNRGKGGTELPAGVERLVGDRSGDLESIKSRDWDAVIDFPTYGPGWVRSLGDALGNRVKHYVFISTNAVYDAPGAQEITNEESPVLDYQGTADPYSLTAPRDLYEYGALKVLCEREAEKQFPGRTLVLRPGWIFGPRNFNAPFIYWAARMERRGEMLAAGDPSTPVQFVDVRDMAAWVIYMIEKRARGIYNVLGPSIPMQLHQLIDAARVATQWVPSLTWVPASWLASQGDRDAWSNLLFWSFESDGYAGMMRMSIERALADGFATRPASVTLKDTFDWYRQQPEARQAELLFRRKRQDDGMGLEKMPIPWETYLEREKEVVAAWCSQKSLQ